MTASCVKTSAVAKALLAVTSLCVTTSATVPPVSPALIIAGNFSLNGERVNMAQYDVSGRVWTNSYQPVLYLYGEANGVVWDTTVNKSEPYDSLYVVGSFDTISQTSQTQYCGIGLWQNGQLSKVGEGLCSHSEGSAHIQVLTSTISQDGQLFVGGTFTSRVWDGKKFVGIYNVARFHAPTQRWLPVGGQLDCTWCVASVYSVAWDEAQQVLYIAGMFDKLDGNWMPAGLAMWDAEHGLRPFEGGGLSMDLPDQDGIGISIAWEPEHELLFVAGYFTNVNRRPCNNIAVWDRTRNSWTCLYDRQFGIAGVTALLLDDQWLYVAGYAAGDSSWHGFERQSPYAIARGNLTNLLGRSESRKRTYAESPDRPAQNANRRATPPPLTRSMLKPRPSITYPSPRRPAEFNAFWNADRARRWLQSSGAASSATSPKENMSWSSWSSSSSSSSSKEPDIVWEWLPNFTGGNGPILSLTPTSLNKRPSLFIAGAFNNYPPVIVWEQQKSGEGSVTGIGGGFELSGLVTSVARMNVQPIGPGPSPSPSGPIDSFAEGYAAILLAICIVGGIVIGVFVAVSCHTRGYQKIPSTADGISLKTLTLSLGEVDMDFKECFERAMSARHLPTHEALLMIDPDEIVLNRVIGEGSFGRVWSGHWRSNAVAVKEFVFAQAAIAGGSVQRDSIVEEIVGEAGIMSCLRHPKILQLYGCSVTVQAIWIVSELCSRGSLRSVLNDRSVQLSIKARWQMAIDIADAMLYLHTRNPPIIHRDLKSQNVFLHESSPGNFVAKLGDWGSARAIALSGQRTMTHGIGTACWLAPEVIEHAQASKASDVYAFGIVLWEIYTREEVHEGLSAAQIILKVAHEGLRPRVPRDCPWKDIMRECWAQQPSHRPTFRVVLSTLTKTFEEFQRRQNSAPNGGTAEVKGVGLVDV